MPHGFRYLAGLQVAVAEQQLVLMRTFCDTVPFQRRDGNAALPALPPERLVKAQPGEFNGDVEARSVAGGGPPVAKVLF